MTRHQVHVWPILRLPGALVLRDWLAITLGHHILAWRPLTERELAHELEHVRQWARHGWRFPVAYLLASLRARRAGLRWYHDNQFEVEAQAAAHGAGSRPTPT